MEKTPARNYTISFAENGVIVKASPFRDGSWAMVYVAHKLSVALDKIKELESE